MALPVGVTRLGTFRGERGPAGSLDFATAESVPADESASVQMVGTEGARGAHFRVPRGLPSPGAVPAAEAVATYLRAADSEPGKALDGALSAGALMDVSAQPSQGNTLQKWGVVLAPGASGAFDDLLVESMNPVVDPKTGRVAGPYTGYKAGDPIVASIGIAWSDDGLHWGKSGVLLAGSGVVGDPDRYGASGPTLVFDVARDEWCLFYIGLDEPGYEGGRKTLCLATTPSLTDPVWTRHGTVLAPSDVTTGPTAWRAAAIWRGSVIRMRETWYCFVNVTNGPGKESIGYATAPDVRGPWTFQDATSPLLTAGVQDQILGDPVVTKTAGGFRMDYYHVGTVDTVPRDWRTSTTDEAFPLGWRPHDMDDTTRITLEPTAGTYDEQAAHKPAILRLGGRTFHYYTAVDWGGRRQVAVAVDPPMPVGGTGAAHPKLRLDGNLDGLTARRTLALALAQAGVIEDESFILRDSFARVATLNGSIADTGQEWSTHAGSFSTVGGVVRNLDAVEGFATIPATTWSSFGARYAPWDQVGAGKAIALLLRYVDTTHLVYVEVKPDGRVEVVYRPGDVVGFTSGSGAIFPGDFLRVDRVGNDFTVSVNGRPLGGFTHTDNTSVHTVGVRTYLEQAAGWRDFTVWE